MFELLGFSCRAFESNELKQRGFGTQRPRFGRAALDPCFLSELLKLRSTTSSIGLGIEMAIPPYS